MRRKQAVRWAGNYVAPISAYVAAPGIAFATVNPRDLEPGTTNERHSSVARAQGCVALLLAFAQYHQIIMRISWEVMPVPSGLRDRDV